MNVTKKFILIAGLSVPIVITAGMMGFSTVVFIISVIVLAALLILDYAVTPSCEYFDIQRYGDNILSLKGNDKIEILVRNNSDYPISMEFVDETPDYHFFVKEQVFCSDKKVLPHTEQIAGYEISSSKRGIYVFGNIHVRYTGRLGLIKKQFKRNVSQEYKVYPNIQDIKKYRLYIQNKIQLDSGSRRIKLKGMGMEFESLKEYENGDDYRKINWKATARANKPIINQYEAEKNQPVIIMIDAGRPMSYSLKGYKKLDYAINASLILSDIVNQSGDMSGLIVFETAVKGFVPAGKGAAHRNIIMETLYKIEEQRTSSNYEEAFLYVSKKQSRRSLIVIFSDFGTEEDAKDLMRYIPVISKKHIPIIILIKNEALERLAEKSAGTSIEESFNIGAAKEFMYERKKIIKALNAQGILCIESPEDKLSVTAVNQYLAIKNKNII